MDTGGAVPVKNDKGEMTMKKVKVKRYVAGKRPDYAHMSDDDDYDDDNNELQEIELQQSLSNKSNNKKTNEVEDRRLRRLRDREAGGSYEEKERIVRHRQVMDPEVLVDDNDIPEQIDDDKMDLDEESQSSADEDNSKSGNEVSKRHKDSDSDDDDDNELDEEERIKHRQLLRQRALEKKQQEEELLGIDEEEQKPGESSESEEEESEYEEEEYSDSEEELAPRLKPVFIRKRDRVTIKEKEMEEQKVKEIEEEQIRLREETVKHTKKVIEEEIRKERQQEKEAEEKIACDFETDDDDENEYEAWKLRELKRIKRERDAKEARDKIKEEILRLRNMTEEEREAELKANPKLVTNERDKGKYKFLQKYYHRGAFFMHEEQDLYKRNYSEPTLEDHFDKTILPKVMQVKNFGMAGRTKYTHLVDQDTSKPQENPWAVTEKVVADKFGGAKQVFDRPSAKKRKN